MSALPAMVAALLFAVSVPADAWNHNRGGTHHTAKRSAEAKREFKHSHPCPATGKRSGACKGWVIDHRVPLCKGGADASWNMTWQTKAAATAKDRWECR